MRYVSFLLVHINVTVQKPITTRTWSEHQFHSMYPTITSTRHTRNHSETLNMQSFRTNSWRNEGETDTAKKYPTVTMRRDNERRTESNMKGESKCVARVTHTSSTQTFSTLYEVTCRFCFKLSLECQRGHMTG